jgi:hypothetical protein
MSTTRPTSAKIIEHSHGLGAPSADNVRRRAQELATIDGRSEFNEEDWRAAKRELHGGHEANGNNGQVEMTALVSEHDMVSSDVGHHVENLPPDDAENLAEELFTEGMDEAVHEQMLAARSEEPSEEEEES